MHITWVERWSDPCGGEAFAISPSITETESTCLRRWFVCRKLSLCCLLQHNSSCRRFRSVLERVPDLKPCPPRFHSFFFAVSSKIGFRDRIRMNNSRSSQTIRSKASPLPPGSNGRRSPSQENMADSTSPGKVQKSWSFNDRTRFRTSLRLKPRPPADGTYQTAVTGREHFSALTLGPSVASAEGVGEDSVEDKPYCDVAMEEVIPAVKTLIRAVR